MMRLKEFRLLIFLCLFPAVVTAQHSISGTIIDTETGETVEGVDIYDNKAGKSYSSGEEGFFIIPNLSDGQYQFYFFKPGYEIISKIISVSGGDTEMNIGLEKLSREMSEVAVIEQRDRMFAIRRMREVEGTSIYAGKKSEVIPVNRVVANTAANNARQIYSQVSGLNIYESNDAGLQLNVGGRGLDPNRSSNFNIRQNGYDISADVLGYPESYYTPPAEALQEIQVIRGAASLQYGSQFGGLINFKMKKPNSSKQIEWISRQSVGSENLLTSFNSLGGTIGQVGYYGYFNYKDGEGFRPNSGFESSNFYLYTEVDVSERTKLSADVTYLSYLAQQPGGLTDAQFYDNPVFSNRPRNWFNVDWKLASLSLDHRLSYRSRFSLTAFGLDASRKSVGFRTNRVSQQDAPDAPRDLILGDFNNWGAEARYLNRYQIGSKSAVFLIGAKYYQSQNTSVQGPGTSGEEANFSLAEERFPNYPNQSDFTFPNRNIALFGEHIIYLNENLSVTPGLRFEHIKTESEGTYKKINFDLAGNPIQNQTFEENRVFNRSFVLLGMGVSYHPAPEIEIFGNFSQNYRSVTFNDIRIVNPAFQIDPDLADESGFTADFGIRGNIGNLLSFDVGGFGLMYDDRLGEVLRAETRINAEGEPEETGRVVRFRGNIGRAFIYGIESLIDLNLLSVLGVENRNTKLNLFANTAVTRSEYFESEIPGVEGNEVEFIPLINLKTGIAFGYKNLMGNLQYTYLSNQFTDASNAHQNKHDNQSGIKGEIPGYDVLDLSLSWTYKKIKLEWGINNLLNNYYFTRRATGYPGPGIIPSPPRAYYLTLQLRFDS